MSTQLMNFHLSAFKFIQLLPNGSLEQREAHKDAEGADGKELTFYFISIFFPLTKPHKMEFSLGEKSPITWDSL